MIDMIFTEAISIINLKKKVIDLTNQTMKNLIKNKKGFTII